LTSHKSWPRLLAVSAQTKAACLEDSFVWSRAAVKPGVIMFFFALFAGVLIVTAPSNFF